jgi:hypothetical protein
MIRKSRKTQDVDLSCLFTDTSLLKKTLAELKSVAKDLVGKIDQQITNPQFERYNERITD